ncbi:unnamed protein product [Vicia faba]|uniref:S-protein homolog n=1 Tax=Vicia faba TaxID=3906 RepID=A0AAV0ZUH6_VICFA|nr:unnamed protein product [Vicia faba]
MSNQVIVSILIFVVYLNISRASHDLVSVSESRRNPSIFETHLNESKINILSLSVVNNMPSGSGEVTMICSFDNGKSHNLESGKPFTFLSNFDTKKCELNWESHHLLFFLYDRDQEGGLAHQKVYWSVKKDGLYHSWDNRSFDKKGNWDTENFDKKGNWDN